MNSEVLQIFQVSRYSEVPRVLWGLRVFRVSPGTPRFFRYSEGLQVFQASLDTPRFSRCSVGFRYSEVPTMYSEFFYLLLGSVNTPMFFRYSEVLYILRGYPGTLRFSKYSKVSLGALRFSRYSEIIKILQLSQVQWRFSWYSGEVSKKLQVHLKVLWLGKYVVNKVPFFLGNPVINITPY